MKMNYFKALILSICALSLATFSSCQNNTNKENQDQKKETKDTVKQVKNTPKQAIEINKKYNDLALYLAGLKVDDKSEIAKLMSNSSWVKYSSISVESWNKFHKSNTEKILVFGI